MAEPEHIGGVDEWWIIGNPSIMLRGGGHPMAQGPRNDLVNQTDL